MRLFALLGGLREGIARHEGEDGVFVVVVVDVFRVRAAGRRGRLGATSAHGARARGDDWRRRPRHGRGSGVTRATMGGEDREEVVSTRRGRPGRDARARARADGERARRDDPRGRRRRGGAHANMSGRCLEDAPSGARVCQSARAADQAAFRLVVDDARRASTGPTARSLVGGECAGVGIASRENLESVAAGHFRPTARRPDRENTAVSPVCCRCSDTHERAFATSAARRIVLTPGSSRPRRRAARHHPELAPRPVASVDEACARWLDI